MGDPAELVCLLQYRVEYRCEIAGGGINDPQNFGGCGLQLQCLARLGQEPRVFHCDDRLRREVFDESDLPFSERKDFLTVNDNHAKKDTILAKSRSEMATRAT